jgi:hypothetical protein
MEHQKESSSLTNKSKIKKKKIRIKIRLKHQHQHLIQLHESQPSPDAASAAGVVSWELGHIFSSSKALTAPTYQLEQHYRSQVTIWYAF